MDEIYNRKHFKLAYIDADGEKHYISKKSYDSELKAQERCFILNTDPRTISKAVSYKCDVCGKWHIGHHATKTLSGSDKIKIQEQYNKWKIVHGIRCI
jgi:hypothetical protein